MTQGKVSVNNKGAGNGGGQVETQTNTPAPPSYEEATGLNGKKGDFLQPSPPIAMRSLWTHEDMSSSPGCSSATYSGDTEMLTSMSWDDERVRRAFIRKVYSILMVQLLVTIAIVALFTFCEPVKEYVQANPGLYWASYAVFFVTYLVLACCTGPRRYFPWNLILLCVFTLSMAYITGMLSSYYNTKSVILCLGITALVCLAVTLFSFQTKIPWLHAIYAVLGSIVFTMFLAFDTQLLMGSRRYTLSPEEYIFGALNIYLDIIYIFSFLLQLFGSTQD
ncbi:protein lifeguard 2 isoform X2 [Spea bombifrons]|uniref:protein lifeguard 2 isoform X2 n=1 Tax=Spea bombifrons TaxID=233779 RepID=UPI00234913BD|nr:protein lifeguard 2 isoform X2 [Spea bombifrons]